jgi:hypothetical protein
MRSIYERALGPEFDRLHPKVQERFGFSSLDGVAQIGRGVMERVWHGPLYTLPFLAVGRWRHIMFPIAGENVPFTIENYAYKDSFGRETVTWVRTFRFSDGDQRFDATMIWSDARGCIVDYLGTHQHLAVDIHASVDERGGIRIRSGAQRFYEGPVAFSFPMMFSGVANVCEWYEEERYRIQVVVENKTWGRLFGYTGSFDVECRKIGPDGVPDHIRPVREERRE